MTHLVIKYNKTGHLDHMTSANNIQYLNHNNIYINLDSIYHHDVSRMNLKLITDFDTLPNTIIVIDQ